MTYEYLFLVKRYIIETVKIRIGGVGMVNKLQRYADLKQVALTLIKTNAVPNPELDLAQIIARGIDDIFEPEMVNPNEIDEYLRTRALHYWFYPSMQMDKVVPKLAEQVADKWEIQNGDEPMLQACLNTVMSYSPEQLETNLGIFLTIELNTTELPHSKSYNRKEQVNSKNDTEELATLDGFDVNEINKYLDVYGIPQLPVARRARGVK